MRINILHQVAQALDYMHGLKPYIIHNDIKPENICFVTERSFYEELGCRAEDLESLSGERVVLSGFQFLDEQVFDTWHQKMGGG